MGQATPPQPPHDAQAAWYDTDLWSGLHPNASKSRKI
jgi:hypothetical protein